jgi:hypothetical protein
LAQASWPIPIPQKDPSHQSSAAQLLCYSSSSPWVNQLASDSVLYNHAGFWSPKATSPNSFRTACTSRE